MNNDTTQKTFVYIVDYREVHDGLVTDEGISVFSTREKAQAEYNKLAWRALHDFAELNWNHDEFDVFESTHLEMWSEDEPYFVEHYELHLTKRELE